MDLSSGTLAELAWIVIRDVSRFSLDETHIGTFQFNRTVNQHSTFVVRVVCGTSTGGSAECIRAAPGPGPLLLHGGNGASVGTFLFVVYDETRSDNGLAGIRARVPSPHSFPFAARLAFWIRLDGRQTLPLLSTILLQFKSRLLFFPVFLLFLPRCPLGLRSLTYSFDLLYTCLRFLFPS